MYIPMVIEDTKDGKEQYNLIDKLFQEDIIVFENEVNDRSALSIKMQLLYLDKKETCERITLLISSGGGSVYAGMGIIDTIKILSKPVDIICTGMVASMGTQILISATGRRKAYKNARIMIHSVSSEASGTIHDMKIDLEETKKLQDLLMSDMSKATKLTMKEVEEVTLRDKWMTSEEALEKGFIDEIVESL